MADEPRRSVRATKGQHTKSLDILDQPAETKKKSTKKGKKAAQQEEEEVEIIRCVCGAVDQGDDEGEPWIACDKCTVWQHNVCVGVSPYDEDTPDNYLCEQCGPQFHKPLLDALKRGEKLWISRRTAYEKELEEREKEDKKKGKKGGKAKGKRTSDIKHEDGKATNGKAKSPSVVADDTPKKEPVARSSSTKRKARDESHDNEVAKEPQPKHRKVSAQVPPSQPNSPSSGLTVKIMDLESTRQPVAKLLQKALVQTITTAVKNGVYVVRPQDSLDAKSERLSIEIEDAIHNTHADKNAYGKQARAISANLKQNQELTNDLLTRTLSPHALAVMSSDDMASSELKRETAEMKARADKQSIMVTDDGPRVRRTHKGDEVVESDNFAMANDSTMSTSRRRSMLDPNVDMATRSRENSPGNDVELPEDIDSYRSRDDIRGNAMPKQPLQVDTKTGQEPVRKASGANFDINKVFSSVQSPTNAQQPRRPSVNVAPQVNNAGVDADIDRMLQDDDDGNDSPPYSPAEDVTDPEIIWRGTVTMDSIAKFSAAAKYIAGANLSNRVPWTDLFQKDFKIAGRIDTEKANEYLCSLRYSPQTDVSVIVLTPTGEAAAQGYKSMFDYFHSKNRYGVLQNKGTGNIRDTYLVPVPPSPAPIPDFIINLEGHKVPESRSEPIILVAVIVRNEYQTPAQLDGAYDAQTPIIGHPQRQMSISGTGPSMSPINQQGGFPPSASPQIPMHMSSEEQQRRQAAEEQRRLAQDAGTKDATKILGDFVRAPTVAFLMPQAYQMRSVEWEIIRDILEKDAKARDDLQHLSHQIELRMGQESQRPGVPGQA